MSASRIPSRNHIVLFVLVFALIADGWASQALPQPRSDVRGIYITALQSLPNAPRKTPLPEFCEQYRIDAKSDAARAVAQGNWIVTSEAMLGELEAVSFAGSFLPGTSGVCSAHDGNIAIFKGAKLVALAFTPKGSSQTLGTVQPLNGGGLLIGDGGGPGVPLGEIHEVDGVPHLTPISSEQSVCNGKAVVPKVYDQVIDIARKSLIAKGWKPQRPATAPGGIDQAAAFAKKGIIEAESCSGTGYGFCLFNYTNGLIQLGVTTVGESYQVMSYEARCP